MKRCTILGVEAEVAETFFERAKGLIGRKGLPAGHGLLIPHCNCIHTFFMRFSIDAKFLDAQGQVVRKVAAIPPGRLLVWGGWRARSVLETSACPSS